MVDLKTGSDRGASSMRLTVASLNLNPHIHMLVADGVFACRDDGSTPTFVATAAPTRDDLRAVIERVIERLQIIERRRVHRAASESCEVNDDGMEGLRCAAGGRGSFARVDDKRERGDAADDSDERAFAPLRMRSHGLVAEVEGFNLHAGVCVVGEDREALERLCRYMAQALAVALVIHAAQFSWVAVGFAVWTVTRSDSREALND